MYKSSAPESFNWKILANLGIWERNKKNSNGSFKIKNF